MRETARHAKILAVRALLQKLSRCYPVHLELLPALLLALVLYLVLSAYGDLPDRIPAGFDVHGEPDDWAGKSMVLLFPGLAIFVYLLLSMITVALAAVRDPLSMINLPKSRKAAITGDQAERLRVFVARSLLVLKSLVLALMAYLGYATVEIASERAESLSPAFLVLIAAILVTSLYMAGKIWRISQARSGD